MLNMFIYGTIALIIIVTLANMFYNALEFTWKKFLAFMHAFLNNQN